MNLASLLLDSATGHGDRVAIHLDGATMTYGELDDASARVAGMLTDRGIGQGDRVAIMLPNVPEFAVVYYGILRAGCIVVPMNPLLKTREIAYYLNDSGAKAIFAWYTAFDEARSGAEKAGAEAIAVDPETFTAGLSAARAVPGMVERQDVDTAIILYTSGTTGHPKGAELTHANLLRNAEVVVTDLTRLTCDDVIFGGLPLFHSFGQTCA